MAKVVTIVPARDPRYDGKGDKEIVDLTRTFLVTAQSPASQLATLELMNATVFIDRGQGPYKAST